MKLRVKIAAVLMAAAGFAAAAPAAVSAMTADGRPVIGITWKSNTQDYAAFKKIIEDAGGIPVELGQVRNEKIDYNADGTVAADDVYPSGMLTEEAAAAGGESEPFR